MSTQDEAVWASDITPRKGKVTKLEDGETMKDRNHSIRLNLDCLLVSQTVDNKPGLGSKYAIADETGLDMARVAKCLRTINANETPFSRIDYGVKTAKSGPFAGETKRGWWPMKKATYQEVMDQADDHSASVERGVRRSRLERVAFAQGLTTKQATKVVASIEARLGINVEEMSETDLEAFEELLVEATD